MSDFLLTRSDLYPDGTSVSAYPVTNWKGGEPNLRLGPVGAASSTQTMSGGQLTFTGLVDGARYVAYALVSGKHTYVRFLLSPVPSTELTGVAGGVLAGSYPEPGFAVDMATQAELDAAVAGVEGFPADTYEFAPAPSGGDDTAALQAAFDAADGGVAILVLRGGTYRVSGALLTVNASKLRVIGLGMDRTTILVTSANAAESIITANTRSDLHFTDLTLDGNSVVACQRGFDAPGSVTNKNIHLERVRVQNVIDPATSTPATWRGIHISPATGRIRILECEALNCGRPIYLEDSGSDVQVKGCLAAGGVAARTTNGIEMFASASADRPVLIEGCTVKDITYDQGGVGSNGDGIRVANHQGVRVIGCEVVNCHTHGVALLGGSFGSVALGNDVRDCNNVSATIRAYGVFLETVPSGDATFGTDAFRGLVAIGNSVRNCERGLGTSYSAGAVIRGNMVQYCDEEGITSDSHRTQIEGNFVLNCWQGGEVATSPYVAGATAPGIVAYSQASIIRGNVVVDNQTVKTMTEGIALSDHSHIVADNFITGITTPILKASDGSQLHMSGNVVREDGNSRIQSIASAASLSPADDADFLLVTGTTQIGNMANSWHGRVLTLKFDSNITIVHDVNGINLNGARNFLAAANDTLTLIHGNDNNWHEIGRRQAGADYETVASANTLAVGRATKVVNVTGTTQINNITDQWAGRILVLKFNDALTVQHLASGINLAGAANFSATANDTLTLVSDGTDWFETARTVI